MHFPDEIFSKLMEKGLQPTNVTYNTILLRLCSSSCIKWKEIEEIMKVVDANDIYLELITFNNVLDVYYKERRLKEARDSMEYMKRIQVESNIISYDTMLNGCCQQVELIEAERVFQLISSVCLELDMFTYNSLLHAP